MFYLACATMGDNPSPAKTDALLACPTRRAGPDLNRQLEVHVHDH